MSIVSAHNLTKRYGRRMGVENVTFTVEPGMIFGFLGPNGAGKSTTIRLLLGFLRPTNGRASVLGHDCWRKSATIKRDVGYLPGDVRLYSWMNVRNGLRIISRVRGVDITASGMALAERFRLDCDVSVRKMSRGMRQKLGIILAVAHDPKLLVLDEPTSALDPLMQEELANYLRERAAAGRTVFFSSHTLSEVEQLCDHVAIVREGRLVADESLAKLREQARREVMIEFADSGAAASIEPPPFLNEVERQGAKWRAQLHGSASDLIHWMNGRGVKDLTVGAPDLESLFRRYYRREGD